MYVRVHVYTRGGVDRARPQLYCRAEGQLWGGHREAAGLSHKPRAPRPDPSLRDETPQGVQTAPLAVPLQGQGRLSRLTGRPGGTAVFLLRGGLSPRVYRLVGEEGPRRGQSGGVRSELHTAQERQRTWGSL